MSISHHVNTISYSNFITHKPLLKHTSTTQPFKKNKKQNKLTIKRV